MPTRPCRAGLCAARPKPSPGSGRFHIEALGVPGSKGRQAEQDAKAHGRQDQGPHRHIGQVSRPRSRKAATRPRTRRSRSACKRSALGQPVPVNVSSGGTRSLPSGYCGGVQALNQMCDATHMPTAAGFKPQKDGLYFVLADRQPRSRNIREPAGCVTWRHDRSLARKHSSAAA